MEIAVLLCNVRLECLTEATLGSLIKGTKTVEAIKRKSSN